MRKTLLAIASMAVSLYGYSQCEDVFISEYTEGGGNNKAVEIYNPTANPIDLSNYTLKRYSNGSTTNPDILQLSGIINPYDVVVIANGQLDSVPLGGGGISPPCDPALQALADILGNDYPDPMYMNGDDALTIEKNGGVFVDIFGKPGEDPGVAWTNDTTANPPFTDSNGGDWWTANETLRRKASVKQGVTTLPASFNPTIEWDTLGWQNWTGFGEHGCECDPNYVSLTETDPIALRVFPNPIQNNALQIRASKDIALVEVYNVIGQPIHRVTPTANAQRITIEPFSNAKGVYVIQVRFTDGQSRTQRVIKK